MKLPDAHTLNRLALSSFSLIMATGIMSIAAFLHGYTQMATVLYYGNIFMYALLLSGILFRLARDKNHLINEFKSHSKGPGALTIVCGTAVLGSQVYLIGNSNAYALGLLILAFMLWLFMTYGLLIIYTLKNEISLIKGLDGSWLLFIVAAQSTAILISNLTGEILSVDFLLLSVVLFYSGILLYVILITLIMYRYVFLSLDVSQLNPPYWINMGAIAISVYSGCVLVENADSLPFLAESAVFITFLTQGIWSFCLWWIPLIFSLGIWKYAVKKYPLKYELSFWSMVFPIGMFSVCSYMIAPAFGLKIVSQISIVFFFLGCLVWTLTFIGMIMHLVKALSSQTVTSYE